MERIACSASSRRSPIFGGVLFSLLAGLIWFVLQRRFPHIWWPFGFDGPALFFSLFFPRIQSGFVFVLLITHTIIGILCGMLASRRAKVSSWVAFFTSVILINYLINLYASRFIRF